MTNYMVLRHVNINSEIRDYEQMNRKLYSSVVLKKKKPFSVKKQNKTLHYEHLH